MKLTTEADLATDWNLTPEKTAQLRVKHDWPHVRLGRFDVRYTDAQLEQIVRDHSVSVASAASQSGLTRRSARRAS